MGRVVWVLLLAAGALACDASTLLVVDVRSDLAPGREFDRVDVSIGGEVVASVEALEENDFLVGQRVAELADLDAGALTLGVALVGQGDRVVLSRSVRVQLDGQLAVTVVMGRDCVGVTCDDADGSACLAGICVPETCYAEALSECDGAATCDADSDCPVGGACSTPICLGGTCLLRADQGRCAADEVCDPDLGCAARARGPVPATAWSLGWSGGGGEISSDVVVVGENVYVAGRVGALEGTDFGGGQIMGALEDAFVVALDRDGAHRWAHLVGGPGEDVARAIDADASGPCVAGRVTDDVTIGGGGPVSSGDGEDAFLVCWDPDGALARVTEQTQGLTGSGSGTVGYIAPEQAMGHPSFRSDVFSLGLVTYRLFAGELPRWPYRWPLPGVARVRRKLTPDAVKWLRRSLSLEERKRFRNARQMLRAFDAIPEFLR